MNQSNKDILAKLMATENITVLHKKVPTAYFDVKNRTLVVPVFKTEMAPELNDLFMGHEVGHALFTPLEGWHDAVCDEGPVFKGYLNVIEDCRIERDIKIKYPGLRKSFYTGYLELAKMDFFGINNKDKNTLNLIDRINLHYKIGTRSEIKFSEEEQVYLNMINKLESFDDVVRVSKLLFEKQQKETEENLESMSQDALQDLLEMNDLLDDEEEDRIPQDSTPSPVDNENEETDEEKKEVSGSGNEESDEESDEEKPEESSDEGGESQIDKLRDELNKSESDESFRDNEGKLHDTDYYTREPEYYELSGKIKYNNFIVGYETIMDLIKENDFDREPIEGYTKDFVNNNKKIISYMVKEFEMKKAAAMYNRSWAAKTGELDMNKLHLYKLKDDIFNRIEVIPEGKNQGLVMVIDWSGAMSGSVRPTFEQASLLSMFCRRIQIPFRLFAFSDQWHNRDSNGDLIDHRNINDRIYGRPLKGHDEDGRRRTSLSPTGLSSEFGLENLHLLEIFNEKMSNVEFTKQLENFLQLSFSIDEGYNYYRDTYNHFDTNWFGPNNLRLGGTPLDHTLVVIRDYLKDFKTQCGLDICTFVALTDGMSHSPFNRSRAELVDRKYNQTYPLYSTNGSNFGIRTTHKLLEWVKKTAGVRTVGFYLTSSTGRNFATDSQQFCGHKLDQWDNQKELESKRKEYNKLSTTFDDGCYDLSIVINQKKIGIDYEQDELNVKDGATKGQLKSALVKAGNSKMKQRVILNKFVEQMAV